MNFIDAVKICLQKYVDFNGRARRSEYWYFWLANVGAQVLLTFVWPIGATVISLGLLLPSIAAGVRRMHDVGKSGWFLLIPIYNLILLLTAGQGGPNEYGDDPKNPMGDDIEAIGS